MDSFFNSWSKCNGWRSPSFPINSSVWLMFGFMQHFSLVQYAKQVCSMLISKSEVGFILRWSVLNGIGTRREGKLHNSLCHVQCEKERNHRLDVAFSWLSQNSIAFLPVSFSQTKCLCVCEWVFFPFPLMQIFVQSLIIKTACTDEFFEMRENFAYAFNV